MANRCYLYSTDRHPSEVSKKIIGIAEWAYEIPLVFKILLSANTEQAKSMIWPECNDKTIIVGYMEKGIIKLSEFLLKLECDPALKTEATQFLNKPQNKQKYIVLECGEIHDMSAQDMSESNTKIFNDILTIDHEIKNTLNQLSPTKPKKGFLNSLFGKKEKSMSIEEIGLGEWSNILYYDLS